MTEPPATSRSSVIAVLAFVAATLLLVDGAVETWWVGSPLRWWLSPLMVAVAAATVWLSRPGGVLFRRAGWRAAAAVSAGGLLALLVLAAWLPAGAADGVRMVGLSGSALFALLTGVAVAAATLELMRTAKPLPPMQRTIALVVVAIVALYALTSLALGIRDETPFAALLHGGGAWRRLPSWLQGVWLGARVLVPVGLVGLGIEVFRRREEWRRILGQALVMTAGLAVSFSPLSSVATALPPGALPIPIPGMIPGSSTSAADAAPTFPVARGEMAQILKAYKQLPGEVDRSGFDVKARATALGADPQAAFAFVRDRIVNEPYPGALRGAAGTLSAGAGNDVDKALLLGALLAEGRHQVRYAHCVLDAGEARQLVAGYFSGALPAFRDADLTASLARGLERQGLSGGRSGEIVAGRARSREWLDAAVSQTAGSDFALVRERMARAGIRPAPSDISSALIEEARQHYWLQLQTGGGWQDLDPSIPGGTAAQSRCPATETFETLPAGLYQTITVSVRNESVKEGAIESRTVLTQRLVVAEHYGDVLLFSNDVREATGAPGADATRLIPALHAGRNVAQGEVFDVVASGPVGFDPLGSALGGDEPARLVAQWLDFTFDAPGRKTSATRAVVDAVPPRERAQGRVTTNPNPDSLMISLLSTHAIAITAGLVQPGAAIETAYAALDVDAANRVFDAVDESGKTRDQDVMTVASHMLGVYALEFGISSERALARMASAAGPHLRIVRDQPMITIASLVIQPAEQDVNVGVSIDLRHDVVRVAPQSPEYVEQAFWTNVQHGLVDGAIEHHLPMIGRTPESRTVFPSFDTSGEVAAARAAGIEMRAAAGSDAVALLQGDLASAGGERLATEVRKDVAIVAPVKPPAGARERRLGVWTIDLRTGHVDALTDSGLREVFVSYTLRVRALVILQVVIVTCLRMRLSCDSLIEKWMAIAQRLIISLQGFPG